MAINPRFSAILGLGLLITLSVKAFVGAAILRPSSDDVARASEAAFSSQGYQIGGLSTFAGRTALVVGQGGCIMYVVPVSEQGWHQETVRKGMVDGQHLWFLFDGKIYPQNQPRWKSLSSFYVSFGLAYGGLGPGYNPVYALVASDECDMTKIDWRAFKTVPFKRQAFLSRSETEDF